MNAVLSMEAIKRDEASGIGALRAFRSVFVEVITTAGIGDAGFAHAACFHFDHATAQIVELMEAAVQLSYARFDAHREAAAKLRLMQAVDNMRAAGLAAPPPPGEPHEH